MTFALVGNQNCGKTTLFNALTGSNQHVGNFPGVTVTRKEGTVRGTPHTVVDLPGIYSLRPYTGEEIVTRDFILHERPDGILNIIDATNPERNLYLTLQLLELHLPTVVALNMMDEVTGNGGSIDVQGMSEALGVPVIPISAAKGSGIHELIDSMIRTAEDKIYPSVRDFCPPGPVHSCIHAVAHEIERDAERVGISPRFAATKLIEGDPKIAEFCRVSENKLELIEHSVIEMEADTDLDRNAALADARYRFIESVCTRTVKKCKESREHRRSVSIDRILTHKYLAIPLFVIILMTIFWLTFSVIGAALSDWLAMGIDALTGVVDRALTAYQINPVVHSLLIDGVFNGVGSVLSFLPIIVTLFFFLSILEDTGYMARVAFVMDRPLRKLGLSGRSFVPMLIGFGCTVPAVMATRTLASERDRKMTILLTPFLSCSAKIPIYTVFSAAFFPEHAALVMGGLYFGGMLLAIPAALLLRSTVFHGGKPVPFVMELPNYRFPSPKSVALLLWEKTKDFLHKAFGVIFLASIVIWFFRTFDTRLNIAADLESSLLAVIGQKIAFLFQPLGFGDWRPATALICGFTAKEAIVSTLSVLIGTTAGDLASSLSLLFTPAAALAFLAFTLLYTPCIAAVATVRKELNSRFFTFAFVCAQCLIAWLVAFVVYRIALLF